MYIGNKHKDNLLTYSDCLPDVVTLRKARQNSGFVANRKTTPTDSQVQSCAREDEATAQPRDN